MASPITAPERIIEQPDPITGLLKKYKVIELPVDPPNTILRRLVPIETEDEDVPIGGRMLNSAETEGILRKQAAGTEIIKVGDRVMMRTTLGSNEVPKSGTVEARLKNNKVRVRWEDGTPERFETKELQKVH